MLENNIVVIGGEKRPSNTFERFDPEVITTSVWRGLAVLRDCSGGEWAKGDYKLKTMRVQADATVVPKSFYSC